MDHVLRRLATFASEGPVRALVLCALITTGAGWIAGGLKVSTARTALISEDDVHWKRYRKFSKEFGIPEDLVVVLKGNSRKDVQTAADAVASALSARNDQVGSVFHRIDLSEFSARAPLYLGYEQLQLLKRLASEPAFAHLRTAESATGRLSALNELLRRAPAIWTERDVPEDFHPMAAVLRGLLMGMSQYALREQDTTPPSIEMISTSLLAEAVGDPLADSGLDSSGYLTTDDGRTAVVFVRPLYHTDEIKVVAPFVAAVRETCKKAVVGRPGITFGLTGIPASQIDEQKAIEHDTRITSVVALAGVILLFLMFFSSKRLLLISLAPVLVGVVCTAAAARMIHGYINLMSSIFLVVLIGMGIDFSIHICARFIELRREGHSPKEAAVRAVENAGRGILTGGLTSAGAFGAVGFSEFKGMAELGVIACVGLLITMVAALIVLPALLAIAGPPDSRIRNGFFGSDTLVNKLIAIKTPALIIVVGSIVPAAWLMSQSEFDYSLLNLLPADSESAVLMAEMVEKRELSANGAVAVAGSLEAARAMEAKFAEKQTIFRAMSAASFLPVNQESRLGQLSKINEILRGGDKTPASLEGKTVTAELEAMAANLERLQDLAFRRGDGTTVAHLEDTIGGINDVVDRIEEGDKAKIRARLDVFTAQLHVMLEDGIQRLETTVKGGMLRPRDLPKAVRERFVSKDGRFAVYAFPKESVWDRPALAEFIKDAREVAPEVTGFAETFYENTGIMKRGFMEAALYASIAVLILLLFDLRGVRDTLLAAFPLACGTVWMLASMRLLGIKYNLANIVALPLIIGVGIDNAVHLLHRFKQSGDVALTLKETGGAVVLSSATTMVGFGALSFASHRGMRSLGEVLFIGVGCCLAAAIFALPAGFSLLGRRREK